MVRTMLWRRLLGAFSPCLLAIRNPTKKEQSCQDIQMGFLKKSRNLWNHFLKSLPTGRQVRNQRAKCSFSELSKYLFGYPP